ncbi:cytochrome b [Aliikangiella marina]|uniref:Cytochrome b n=1 Tax=Aliikangiella marina TaxID=1712262 RepID=A0A545T4B9_9GAMM|nr:cytochrome b [Aliikangiella marina]TQV72020.1 cytochrome b [Aliikangiella marina]TQV72073.1 cytochrome b [Aliikangiella marina]
MLKNSPKKYGLVAKFLHWLTAITVIALFAVGLWMVDLDYYDAWYTKAPYYHKSVGILLGLLMVLRMLWRISNTTPVPPKNHQLWEIQSARLAHGLFYLLIFLMIISGYLISTADNRSIDVMGWFEIPSLGSLIDNQEDTAGLIHEWLAYVLIGLASIHGIAALKHHFYDKDETLKRMI